MASIRTKTTLKRKIDLLREDLEARRRRLAAASATVDRWVERTPTQPPLHGDLYEERVSAAHTAKAYDLLRVYQAAWSMVEEGASDRWIGDTLHLALGEVRSRDYVTEWTA